MNSIILTRKEVDTHVVDGELKVKEAYLRCERKWSLSGVRLTGDSKDICTVHLARTRGNSLLTYLNLCRKAGRLEIVHVS